MTYLFLGEDSLAKDAKIHELKNKIFSSPQAVEFDYQLHHAHKLEPAILKQSLMNLPAIASRRLVVIREGHRLSPQNQELIIEFLEKKYDHAVLILDSDEWEATNQFVRKVKPGATVIDFQSSRKLNVFDITRAIDQQKETEALKILDELLSLGIHPLQIMGGLVWFWGKSREKMPRQRFEKGLLSLQEADLNIKRSRLKSEYALELLIVKLCWKEVY